MRRSLWGRTRLYGPVWDDEGEGATARSLDGVDGKAGSVWGRRQQVPKLPNRSTWMPERQWAGVGFGVSLGDGGAVVGTEVEPSLNRLSDGGSGF